MCTYSSPIDAYTVFLKYQSFWKKTESCCINLDHFFYFHEHNNIGKLHKHTDTVHYTVNKHIRSSQSPGNELHWQLPYDSVR